MLLKVKINRISEFFFFFVKYRELDIFLFGHKVCVYGGGVNDGGSRYDRRGLNK